MFILLQNGKKKQNITHVFILLQNGKKNRIYLVVIKQNYQSIWIHKYVATQLKTNNNQRCQQTQNTIDN